MTNSPIELFWSSLKRLDIKTYLLLYKCGEACTTVLHNVSSLSIRLDANEKSFWFDADRFINKKISAMHWYLQPLLLWRIRKLTNWEFVSDIFSQLPRPANLSLILVALNCCWQLQAMFWSKFEHFQVSGRSISWEPFLSLTWCFRGTSFFGHQMAPDLTTRWRYLHQLQFWPQGGATRISWKLGHQVAFIQNLVIRWRHLHCLIPKLASRLCHLHCHIALECPIGIIS